jgi:ubiquinone/menaquinone biosynthesis C-methylase UbiE
MDNVPTRLIQATFDTIADGYDNPALRFFATSAAHMATKLELRGDEAVLDVACGTGHASLAIAALLPRGRLTAIDFSPAMLAQARKKAAAFAGHNLEFVERDMQAIDWQAEFDAAVCAFGIFFVEDMDAQLSRIARAVKPGGRVVITSFAEGYMMPLRSLMMARLARFGVEAPPQPWRSIASEESCRDFFHRAGLRDIEVEHKELGYFLADAEAWWSVIWNAGFRRLVNRLSPEDQVRFKADHLAEIEELRTRDGIRMDVGVLFSSGTRSR